MIVVDVAFPFGYVHATPWSTHVNEGAVEWPPSPWRLLRALVATWHTRCADVDDDAAYAVLSALAAPPAVRVSPRCEASIRTYLPGEADRSGAAEPKRDLVVDAFAAVEPGSGVAYRWDVDVDEQSAATLARFVEALPYLGRAESVCEATVRFDDDDGQGWVQPGDDSSGVGRRTMVAQEPLDLDALSVHIRAMRKGGRLQPPGARWVRYAVDEPVTSTARRHHRVRRREPAVAVRVALTGTPVSVRSTVVVGEKLRAVTHLRYAAATGRRISAVLAGKDGDGVPLRDHRHAHWLPVDDDGDGLLDAAYIWAPGGLDDVDVAAIDAVRKLDFHGGDGLEGRTLHVAVEQVVRSDTSREELRRRAPGLFARSVSWRSATPFVVTRHRKRQSEEDFVADNVRRELVARALPAPIDIELDRTNSWGSFRRYRSQESLRSARSGFGLVLQFPEPIDGPLCLGALSHFGLGRFEPIGDEQQPVS